MTDTAIHPGGLIMPELDAEPIALTEQIAVETSSKDAKELAALNMSRGWEQIRAAMQTDVYRLRNMTGADLHGKDFSEVGQAFLVASLTADKLQHYLDMVDNATKAIVEHDRRTNSK